MEALNRYSRAARNGAIGEETAEGLLSTHVSVYDPIDILLPDGLPVEVKTCSRWIGSAHTSTRRRRGRFIFSVAQHKQLVDSGGYYLLCLLEDYGAISQCKTIPALDIYHPSFGNGCEGVSISWPNFFPEV